VILASFIDPEPARAFFGPGALGDSMIGIRMTPVGFFGASEQIAQ
jgi:hypothetical protein